jgi:hypothetical protein
MVKADALKVNLIVFSGLYYNTMSNSEFHHNSRNLERIERKPEVI